MQLLSQGQRQRRTSPHAPHHPMKQLVRLLTRQGESFLKELKARWDDHIKSTQMIRDILMVRRQRRWVYLLMSLGTVQRHGAALSSSMQRRFSDAAPPAACQLLAQGRG